MALLQISEPGQSTAPHHHNLACGIDLGTTNSLVASVISGKTKLLADKDNEVMLPSIVHLVGIEKQRLEVKLVIMLKQTQPTLFFRSSDLWVWDLKRLVNSKIVHIDCLKMEITFYFKRQ